MKIPRLVWNSEIDGWDDLLFEIKPCKVALLVRGRNAWHSTWVEHFIRDADLYSNVTSAKKGAEVLRERGNVFTILEAPAIRLVGQNRSFVFVDANQDKGFSRFQGQNFEICESEYGRFIDGLHCGISLRGASEVILDLERYWNNPVLSSQVILSGETSGLNEIEECSEEFRTFKSKAVGSKFTLAWDEGDNEFIGDYVFSIAHQWAMSVKKVHNSEQKDKTNSFIRYLSEEIKCLTYKNWQDIAKGDLRIMQQEFLHLNKEYNSAQALLDRLYDKLFVAEEVVEKVAEQRMTKTSSSAMMKKYREKHEKAKTTLESLYQEREVVADRCEHLRIRRNDLRTRITRITEELERVPDFGAMELELHLALELEVDLDLD